MDVLHTETDYLSILQIPVSEHLPNKLNKITIYIALFQSYRPLKGFYSTSHIHPFIQRNSSITLSQQSSNLGFSILPKDTLACGLEQL